jgi:hypothetical protein
MNGVRVIRDATGARIVHDCEPVISVRIELGARVDLFSDDEIVARYQQRLSALAAALVDSPQLRWDVAARRWVPRGRAICCVVERIVDEPAVFVDEVELTVGELGAMLSSHGATICVVFLDD